MLYSCTYVETLGVKRLKLWNTLWVKRKRNHYTLAGKTQANSVLNCNMVLL